MKRPATLTVQDLPEELEPKSGYKLLQCAIRFHAVSRVLDHMSALSASAMLMRPAKDSGAMYSVVPIFCVMETPQGVAYGQCRPIQ
eukprot:2174691-Amphidinium_carterae.1